MSWSAEQYSKFENERNRPIHDLLANIRTEKVRTAADIGCGPGNSTELLCRRFPDAVVTGIDNSGNMIAAARERLPAVQFEMDDVAKWRNPGPFDVIFANASLQWVPDHASLLPALLAKLARGGSLAVQMPDNFDEPAHRLMREVAAAGPWADKLAGASDARAPRQRAEWYFRVLRGASADVDVWKTTYYHLLAGGAAAIVEWFKGTGLRPFVDPLDGNGREEFLARYQKAVAAAYPALPDGSVLLPFPRLFFVAVR